MFTSVWRDNVCGITHSSRHTVYVYWTLHCMLLHPNGCRGLSLPIIFTAKTAVRLLCAGPHCPTKWCEVPLCSTSKMRTLILRHTHMCTYRHTSSLHWTCWKVQEFTVLSFPVLDHTMRDATVASRIVWSSTEHVYRSLHTVMGCTDKRCRFATPLFWTSKMSWSTGC